MWRKQILQKSRDLCGPNFSGPKLAQTSIVLASDIKIFEAQDQAGPPRCVQIFIKRHQTFSQPLCLLKRKFRNSYAQPTFLTIFFFLICFRPTQIVIPQLIMSIVTHLVRIHLIFHLVMRLGGLHHKVRHLSLVLYFLVKQQCQKIAAVQACATLQPFSGIAITSQPIFYH